MAYLRFDSLTAWQKRDFMRLAAAVHDWQRHTDETAGERIAAQVALLPHELLLEVQPTLREFGRSVRGDSSARMARVGEAYVLREYEVAGFGNRNTAGLFADQGGARFVLSGRDVVGLSAAVSTPRMVSWIHRPANASAMDAFCDAVEAKGKSPAWLRMHEEVADDEAEIVVVAVSIRPFTAGEVARGRSSRLPRGVR